ncbi:hypothetical protein [Streptomyces rapamycinicus]|uniref:Uncharacterized protein n=2 Tax=Streptomyces rapamycinicus TaxID=1226757 RepID=A0A0A0N7X9_STRRN|nr:hypothetical protein [Streptomyces rapamycinicus]AGP52734.1 hypothetical protein M271_05540 [Streptomyces rapamycinicus NRRL 5491]MBB4780209.1 hypothetical protein [Streptomyces rapamycinicus]RLV75136.1 hypothetical protein D3C57_137960 [Streptomyces rapamycinicus NRRL 5491]UTO60947.1 hypothetical protein LJB45_00570 [Streptomyces rapamycinicus]UTP28891.1 hypothetical protein LIV37_05690 [Streptomyces rapamycinicus NRRL 5491]
MATDGSMRADGVLPRLLLVVVLALGAFVMHTLGHPDGGSGSGMTHSARHAPGEMRPAAYNGDPAAYNGDPRVYSGDPGPYGGGTAATGTGPQWAAPAPPAGAAHAPAAPETKPCEPMTGMDMASLCVAVLGVWVLGALLRAVLTRRSGPPLRIPVVAPVVARPDPPSPGPDLTALSVLRI